MQNANIIRAIYHERGSKGLPLVRIYRHLLDPELFLQGYRKIYRNAGATTKGVTEETVDGMSVKKIQGIIELLRQERYRWTPSRRMDIPKPKGGTRPLGIPTWSDKLVEEVLRSLLEPYYEQRFSPHSHGFRENRGCHSALREIRDTWKGTVWFIEGDIKGCYDNIDRTILLEIIRRDIHDGKLITLIDGLLNAGYMEDWRYHDTLSGVPQGGIISPLLANIYLNELDRYVEDTLRPMYTRGENRGKSPAYDRIRRLLAYARGRGDLDEIKRLKVERRKHMSGKPCDPDYRRLRYVRYADDFLLGFVGPKNEAEEIRRRLGEFLEQRLKLTLSAEKTLITHASDGKARFLGHEIKVIRKGDLIARNGRRAANGVIAILMPQTVVRKYRERFCKGGKACHRAELTVDTDYTILQRYQSILRGVYNYYCIAVNVSKRMSRIKWILETSMLKTLASKHKSSVNRIDKMYRVPNLEYKTYRVVIDRPNKKPLVAVFGGMSLKRIPEGTGAKDFQFEPAWFQPTRKRSELVQRLMRGECELCEAGPVEVHHIRKLADIDKPGQRSKALWKKIMSARKRKTLIVCENCHDAIHAGEYDGPTL